MQIVFEVSHTYYKTSIMNKEIMKSLGLNRKQYRRLLQSIVIKTPNISELPESKTDDSIENNSQNLS